VISPLFGPRKVRPTPKLSSDLDILGGGGPRKERGRACCGRLGRKKREPANWSVPPPEGYPVVCFSALLGGPGPSLYM
jgi:hypothetical protein